MWEKVAAMFIFSISKEMGKALPLHNEKYCGILLVQSIHPTVIKNSWKCVIVHRFPRVFDHRWVNALDKQNLLTLSSNSC
jgi:hypothetical protein